MKRLNSIILAHYKKAIATNNPYISYAITDDPTIWYIKIHSFDGDEGEFTGGEYYAKLTIPDDFPYKPPSFEMLTPNGVYSLGGKVCISVGEFHSQNYLPTLGISGFSGQLLSGMIGWRTLGNGIRLLHTDVSTKKIIAAESKQYNAQHLKNIEQLFECK